MENNLFENTKWLNQIKCDAEKAKLMTPHEYEAEVERKRIEAQNSIKKIKKIIDDETAYNKKTAVRKKSIMLNNNIEKSKINEIIKTKRTKGVIFVNGHYENCVIKPLARPRERLCKRRARSWRGHMLCVGRRRRARRAVGKRTRL